MSASAAARDADRSSKAARKASQASRSGPEAAAAKASAFSRSKARRCFTDRHMPRQSSALFSKRLLVHAGPKPRPLTVYGMPGMAAPQACEQPVALAQ